METEPEIPTGNFTLNLKQTRNLQPKNGLVEDIRNNPPAPNGFKWQFQMVWKYELETYLSYIKIKLLIYQMLKKQHTIKNCTLIGSGK